MTDQHPTTNSRTFLHTGLGPEYPAWEKKGATLQIIDSGLDPGVGSRTGNVVVPSPLEFRGDSAKVWEGVPAHSNRHKDHGRSIR